MNKKQREQIYNKHKGRCAYCGDKIEFKDMQVDHFKPKHLGGKDEMDNYMPSCRACNFYKATFGLESSMVTLYSSCNLIARSDMASIVDSLVAPLSVVNALVVAMCMKNQKEVIGTLETLEQIWDEYQVYSKDELNMVGEPVEFTEIEGVIHE